MFVLFRDVDQLFSYVHPEANAQKSWMHTKYLFKSQAYFSYRKDQMQ